MARLRSTLGTLAALTALLGVACSVPSSDDDASSDESALSAAFDKNSVVDDLRFTDVAAATPDVAKVQAFLQSTPFRNLFLMHTTSPLATYRDGGKLASEILVDAARANRINPIALLVALEAESSLVSATSLDEDAVKVAFRCVCPEDAECQTHPERYVGFAKQAACYATTMRAAIDAQKAGKATKNGWRRGAPHETDDEPTKILVTPSSTATAALYDYTPVVGKAGGGDRALGGVSNWFELWKRFTTALSYKGPVGPAVPADSGVAENPLCVTSDDCSGDLPVCDTTLSRCVACASDFGGKTRACPDSAHPACSKAGTCDVCSATNATACAATDATPACVTTAAGLFSSATASCGCATDEACGPGRICDDALGPAGLCVDGCRVIGGKDSCAPIGTCSAKNGSKGTCNVTADAGAPTKPATNGDAGADAGSSSSSGSLGEPQEQTPETPTPKQPPSGHGSQDRSLPAAPSPEFAPLAPPPAGAGVGCSAAPSGASQATGAGLGLALAGLALVRRRRSR